MTFKTSSPQLEYFKIKFPKLVKKDYTILFSRYPEIWFTNKDGQKIIFDMRDGRLLN
tara:strand:+ start:2435 stop:2605 length:171 start_codon:yes stop_codon:yes gene_type:complete